MIRHQKTFGIAVLLAVAAGCGGVVDERLDESDSMPRFGADTAPSAEFRAIDEHLERGTNPYFGRGQIAQLIESREQLSDWPLRRCVVLANLAKESRRLGDIPQAKGAINEAIAVAELEPSAMPELALLRLIRAVAFPREAGCWNNRTRNSNIRTNAA